MGQPRINAKEGRKVITLIVNLLVGISQFFTITFLLVGWFWSIAWGGLLMIHSRKLELASCRLSFLFKGSDEPALGFSETWPF